MATMADVAKRAGVSLSTVSYALSGTRPITEETRSRIYKAIAELGYHPNALARGLVTKRPKVIGLLFPSMTKGLFEVQLEFVTSAGETASRLGYGLLLWTAPSEEADILRLTKEGLIAGLILTEVRLHDARVDLLRSLGYPFTLIGRCENNDGVSFVDLDFEEATRLSVRHLAELGHRRIALLNYSQALLDIGYGPTVRTQRGFQTALQEFGLQGVHLACEPTLSCGYEAMKTLRREDPALSAVITTNENVGRGVLQALHEMGMRVPEDFSIVARCSSRIAEMCTPPLTGIDVPTSQMGHLGTEILIRYLEGDEREPTQIVLPPVWTPRSSLGPCRR